MAKRKPSRGGLLAVQMAFEDIVELERVAGDPAYNVWIAAGRPRLDRVDQKADPHDTDRGG